MGRTHTPLRSAAVTATSPSRSAATAPLARAADVAVSALALLLALPVLAAVALAVRLSSHGPVLERTPATGRDGRAVQLLAFRTLVDGGRTEAHERFRSVIGAGADATPVTSVGQVLQRLRLDRLPRLLNVLAGHRSLFG
jgi:lipopolysaccharide/colanic/teichoic acid biosynthesis glycosyltransferase